MKLWVIAQLTGTVIQASAQELKVGDTMPNLVFNNVINYPESSLDFSDLKKKWVILNFSNLACESNFKPFDRIDSLQTIFADKMQLLMLYPEEKDSAIKFFNRVRNKLTIPNVPIITNARMQWELFTSRYTPFQVWISPGGRIEYITNGYNLSKRRLEQVMRGERPLMANITSEQKPNHSNGPGTLLFSSSLSLCESGKIVGEYEKRFDGNSMMMSSECASVLELFIKAFRQYNKYNFRTSHEVRFLVEDTFAFTRPKEGDILDEWKQKHSYTYELRLPLAFEDRRYLFMQQDLQEFFGLDATIERRKLKCLALVKTGSLNKLISKGGKKQNRLFSSTLVHPAKTTEAVVTNLPFAQLSESLRSFLAYFEDIPFADQTGFTGNIDMKISQSALDPFDLEIMKTELRRYNLDLVESEAIFDVLVIKRRE
ncbi:MAG: DUF3738 domain-containing protein [Flavisolibacter sp.]